MSVGFADTQQMVVEARRLHFRPRVRGVALARLGEGDMKLSSFLCSAEALWQVIGWRVCDTSFLPVVPGVRCPVASSFVGSEWYTRLVIGVRQSALVLLRGHVCCTCGAFLCGAQRRGVLLCGANNGEGCMTLRLRV